MKSQIWSPDQVKTQGEFISFSQQAQAVEREPARLERVEESQGVDNFNLAPGYWDALMKDALFRTKFEASVEEEVRNRLLSRLENDRTQVLPQIAEEAMKRGYREGQHLAKEELEAKVNQLEGQLALTWEEKLQELDQTKKAVSQTFEAILEEWKVQRTALMHSHETEWCQAMGHLLKRFQIERAGSYERALKEWMREAIPDFISQSPITIFVSQQDLEKTMTTLNSSDSIQMWKIQVDTELKEGQIRFEAGKGGALFDSQNNYEKLFNWLEMQT